MDEGPYISLTYTCFDRQPRHTAAGAITRWHGSDVTVTTPFLPMPTIQQYIGADHELSFWINPEYYCRLNRTKVEIISGN